MKKIITLARSHKIASFVVITAIIAGGYFAYQKNNSGEDAVDYTTAVVEKGMLNSSVFGTGQVQAKNQVNLKPQAAGDGLDVIEVKVENDQKVSDGQVIAVLDSGQAQEKIQSAQLQLNSAELKMKQALEQYDTKTYDDKLARQLQENTVKQQQIELNNAYKDLEDYKIKAPFDGVATNLSIETGDSISRDEVLASVITEELQASISLNEVDAAKVKTGDRAVLTFDALEEVETTGEVSKVDTIGKVDQGVVSYEAEINFKNPSKYLKPGMSVTANVITESKQDVVLVPNSAVKSQQDAYYVQVMEKPEEKTAASDEAGNNLRSQQVEIGLSNDKVTEITSGLKEGDIVVTGTISQADETRPDQNQGFQLPGTTGSMGGGGGMK
ncbi:MAG: efflux RND transporter periplasmic adaptor subunit [Candidatus Moranbacteria bacterium]|nr:efflux RND transporter periplasmic adaptor subunit [Candidatus Moranbacteria bacterium]